MTSHIIVLPFSEKWHDEVTSEFSSQDLGEEINVWNECCLQNDWDVGSVEQLDWIWLSESSHLSGTKAKLNTETLEVNDNKDNDDSTE